MNKKSSPTIFLIFIGIFIALVIGQNFRRYHIIKNYSLNVFTSCDVEKHNCFQVASGTVDLLPFQVEYSVRKQISENELRMQILEFSRGNKIAAIKSLRDALPDIGLKDAKDWVEAFWKFLDKNYSRRQPYGFNNENVGKVISTLREVFRGTIIQFTTGEHWIVDVFNNVDDKIDLVSVMDTSKVTSVRLCDLRGLLIVGQRNPHTLSPVTN